MFPTVWDRRQLEACRDTWRNRYQVELAEPSDADCPADLDVLGYIDELVARYAGRIHGVMSSSDYPGATVAGALATRLGLPGCPPATVIRCSHKYYSRLAQREAVPEATAAFELLDPREPGAGDPALAFPCFVKPVKGAFSILSERIESPEELRAFLARRAVADFVGEYMGVFNRLVAGLTDFEVNGSWFLAEELLHGTQVTVEGWVRDGEVGILGFVDSILHPGRPCFARFDYPSALRPEILETMADVARRVAVHLGLSDTLFNIEMIYEAATDRVRIVEINPRMCGQFADLYEKVDGVNGYQLALALATGDPLPEPAPRRPRTALATSFPLRVFTPSRVLAAPDAATVERAEASIPGALVWSECSEGENLERFEDEDGHSSRYCVVNLGGPTRRELLARLDRIESALGFRFEPLAGRGQEASRPR